MLNFEITTNSVLGSVADHQLHMFRFNSSQHYIAIICILSQDSRGYDSNSKRKVDANSFDPAYTCFRISRRTGKTSFGHFNKILGDGNSGQGKLKINY